VIRMEKRDPYSVYRKGAGMNKLSEHEYTTYPRKFDAYRWYKPLAVGALFSVFFLVLGFLSGPITKLLFGSAVSQSGGYDDMDFYTSAGAFSTCYEAVIPILCLLLAVLIVRDRPFSSYLSSMGGWRWDVFLKTFAGGLLFVGVPTAVWHLMQGSSGVIHFTAGGFILLTLLGPLQGVAEELVYRGYIMQTVSSWFRLPVAGIIAQAILFAAVHPYNVIGVINIFAAGIIYALICVYTKGIEAGSALHIINNMTTIYMSGFGFGAITSEQSISEVLLENAVKIAFFIFIIIASKKFHWFDEVKYDDAAGFNAKKKK